jgi:DNA-binding NtrC family response regulator
VRELANVLERGVILSSGGVFDIDRALLETAPQRPVADDVLADAETRILSASELEKLERANLLRALEACNWKVAGAEGAATLLGIHASTLNSRLPRARDAATVEGIARWISGFTLGEVSEWRDVRVRARPSKPLQPPRWRHHLA